MSGCTIVVSNIPRDMDLHVLRNDMGSYGTIVRWAMSPGPMRVYARYETREMAAAAISGLREHRRLLVDYVTTPDT